MTKIDATTQVERLTGKNLKLGNENDPMVVAAAAAAKKAAAKGPKVLKGYHSSNNAYMLVYTEQKTLERIRDDELKRATVKERVKVRAIKEARRKERAKKRERLKRKWEMEMEEEEEEEEERAMLAEATPSKRLKTCDGKAVVKIVERKAVSRDDDGDGGDVNRVETSVPEEPKKEVKDEPKEECEEPKKEAEEEDPKKQAVILSAPKTEKTSVNCNSNSCSTATAFTGTISHHEDTSDGDVCEGTCCLGINTTTTDEDDEEDDFFEDITSSEEEEEEDDDDDVGDPYGYVYVNSLVYPSSFPIYLRSVSSKLCISI